MEQILYILIDALCSGLPYALLVLGVFISYRILDLADLTCEGSFTMGTAVTVAGILLGVNPFLATLLAIISGFLVGIITGLLHTKLHINALLSGIITLTGLFSINMLIMGLASPGQAFNNALAVGEHKTIFESFLAFFPKRNYNVIFISAIIVIVTVLVIYWLFGTEFGMSLRATGMNQSMARAQGINTSVMIIIGLAISNALIATGGSLFAQYYKSADSNIGVGALVIGLSSIILGESLFGKRTFKNWIISVSVGSIVYYLIVSIALAIGLPSFLLKLLYSILIVVILAASLIKTIVKNKGDKKHVRD